MMTAIRSLREKSCQKVLPQIGKVHGLIMKWLLKYWLLQQMLIHTWGTVYIHKTIHRIYMLIAALNLMDLLTFTCLFSVCSLGLGCDHTLRLIIKNQGFKPKKSLFIVNSVGLCEYKLLCRKNLFKIIYIYTVYGSPYISQSHARCHLPLSLQEVMGNTLQHVDTVHCL